MEEEKTDEGNPIADRLESLIKAVQDVESYLTSCIHDLGENTNFKKKKNKDRLVTRLNQWAMVLGREPIERACRIIDMEYIRLLEEHNEEPNVFMIGESTGWSNVYYIHEDVNNCECDFFKNNVMRANEAYLCEHLIAIRLAKLMKIKPMKLSDFEEERKQAEAEQENTIP